MKIKTGSIILTCLAIFVHIHAEEMTDVIWTSRLVHEPWVSKGRLVSYDAGRANDKFYFSAVYYDSKNKAWPLLGSFWNVVQMIRSEFPNGIDSDFAQNNLVSTLTRFNGAVGLIANEHSVDQVIDGEAHLDSDKETQQLVRQLLDKPIVTVSDNCWSIQFMTIAYCERIQMNFMKGRLKPFSVESEFVEPITDGGDSYNLTPALVKAALEHKKVIISRWQKTAATNGE